MIEGKNFKILEFQDIVDACNNMEEAGNAIGAKLKAMNVDGKGDQDRAEFLGDLLTVLAAAGVGAAVAKTQGGLVLMKEGCTQEDHKEAVAALEELRKKIKKSTAPIPFGSMPSGDAPPLRSG